VKRETRLEAADNDCRDPAARLHPTARPATMIAALQAASRAALDQIIWNRPRIAVDDPEALHQIRVGFRHLDAAIRFFAANIPKHERALLARELKWLGRRLSRAREIDVFLEEVISRLPCGRRAEPDIAAVERLCRREQKREYARVRRVLASGRFQDFASAIESSLIDGKDLLSHPHASSDQAASGLMEMKRRLRKGRHVDVLRRDDLHKLRLRVKRMRYATGFVVPLLDRRNTKPARRMSELLKRLQNELGAITDQKAHKDFFKELRECGSSRSAADGGEIDWRGVERFLFAGRRKAKAVSLKRAKKIYRKLEEIELS
jgi:CHAD domain-containing protein